VILAVLVTVVIMSLLSYRYVDLMNQQYRSSLNVARTAQARALAESGVNYTALLLAGPTTTSDLLNLNPYNNSDLFGKQLVHDPGDGSPKGYFAVIAPAWGSQLTNNSGQWNMGVMDESSKINIDAVMKADNTGNTLYEILQGLPNMTPDVAANIVTWLNTGAQLQGAAGATSSDYGGNDPPYVAKNGPLDSLDELLLVQGVTPDLLYGGDLNRNSMIDPDENPPDSNNPLGWSSMLTRYSREQNLDSTLQPRVYVNNKTLSTLWSQLSSTDGLDPSLAVYIVMYRYYGGTAVTTTSSSTSDKTTAGAKTSTTPQVATSLPSDLQSNLNNTKKQLTNINSLYQLINTQVTVPGAKPSDKSTTYASPLNNSSSQSSLLPQLLDKCTTNKNVELPARVNILTAPEAVLYALAGITPKTTTSSATVSVGGTTGTISLTTTGTSNTSGKSGSSGNSSNQTPQPVLSTTDVQNILANRPSPTDANFNSPTYQTPAWLMTQCNIKASAMQTLEPYITCSTQTFRFHVVGYFDGLGPACRVEAVVDLNAGRPRLLHFRDLTNLGKGFDLTQLK
jgi:hypothetical protein